MQDPASYDGEYSIADLHPSMRRDLIPPCVISPTKTWADGHILCPKFLVPSGAAASRWIRALPTNRSARSNKSLPPRAGFFSGFHQHRPRYGERLLASMELGRRLYHHSCISGVKRCGKSVNTVWVGREPGWSSSTA